MRDQSTEHRAGVNDLEEVAPHNAPKDIQVRKTHTEKEPMCEKTEDEPDSLADLLRTSGIFQGRLFKSRLGAYFIRHLEHVVHFLSPIVSGLAAAALLFFIDWCRGTKSEQSLAFKFCAGMAEHIHPELILAAALLVAVSNVLIGSFFVSFVRWAILMPIVQLVHHVMLTAAGAIAALIVAAVFASGVGAGVYVMLVYAFLVLLLGGAEMQFAEWVAKKSISTIKGWMPIPAFIAMNVALAGVSAYYLSAQLAHQHT